MTAIFTERTVLIFIDIPLAILAAFLFFTRPRWMRRERKRQLELAGMHEFSQDLDGLAAMCTCKESYSHHVHTGDRYSCPCPECTKWNGTKDSARREEAEAS